MHARAEPPWKLGGRSGVCGTVRSDRGGWNRTRPDRPSCVPPPAGNGLPATAGRCCRCQARAGGEGCRDRRGARHRSRSPSARGAGRPRRAGKARTAGNLTLSKDGRVRSPVCGGAGGNRAAGACRVWAGPDQGRPRPPPAACAGRRPPPLLGLLLPGQFRVRFPGHDPEAPSSGCRGPSRLRRTPCAMISVQPAFSSGRVSLSTGP